MKKKFLDDDDEEERVLIDNIKKKKKKEKKNLFLNKQAKQTLPALGGFRSMTSFIAFANNRKLTNSINKT